MGASGQRVIRLDRDGPMFLVSFGSMGLFSMLLFFALWSSGTEGMVTADAGEDGKIRWLGVI